MLYDPRNFQQGSFDDEIGGYAGEESRSRTHRPVRHLGNTEQAIEAARLARQQAEARARQQKQQRNNRVSQNGLPRVRQHTAHQGDDEIDEDQRDAEVYEDEDLSTRPPRCAIKYQPLATSLSGMKGANINYTSPPPPN